MSFSVSSALVEGVGPPKRNAAACYVAQLRAFAQRRAGVAWPPDDASDDESTSSAATNTASTPPWRTQRCASSDSAVDCDECDDDVDAAAARAWRTPSVVVSDFSDETPWLADDDDERSRRLSQLSDCSSCGGSLCAPQRKTSDCSTCSSVSGDDEPSSPRAAPGATYMRQSKVCAFFYTKISLKYNCVAKFGSEAT
jgi:hypothetical protein